jgi:hypothetical protein
LEKEVAEGGASIGVEVAESISTKVEICPNDFDAKAAETTLSLLSAI